MTKTTALCVSSACLAASLLSLPLSNMPQFIMKSTHPEHEDYGKPGWRDDILVFCNNYKYAEKHISTYLVTGNLLRVSASMMRPCKHSNLIDSLFASVHYGLPAMLENLCKQDAVLRLDSNKTQLNTIKGVPALSLAFRKPATKFQTTLRVASGHARKTRRKCEVEYTFLPSCIGNHVPCSVAHRVASSS